MRARASCAEGRVQRVGRRRQLAPLYREGVPSGGGGAALELPQQRALSDPSRTVNEHHGRRLIVSQASLEQVELGLATDESRTVAIRQPRRQRDVLGPRTSRPMTVPLVAHECRSVTAIDTLWEPLSGGVLGRLAATSRRSAPPADCRGRT